MNIVSLIMQFLGPMILNKLAGAVGINSTLAQKAIAAAVPAILAGLVGKASQPGGGSAIGAVLGKLDPGILGQLGGLIGGSGQSKLVEQGAGALGSLLGGSQLGALTGALGKFTGASDSATKGLLGMLAPAILGTLAQQQQSAGLDSGGLAKMLMGQKDNIAAAMPQDFAKLLSGSGLLDGFGGGSTMGSKLGQAASAATAAAGTAAGMVGRATESVGSAAGTAARSAQSMGSTASSAASSAGGSAMGAAKAAASGFNWWPWAAAVVAAIALWWLYGMFSGPTRMALPAAPAITVGSTDVGAELAGVFGGLTGTLATVKDEASAKAALPKLTEAAGRLNTINGMMDKFSPDAKKALAGYSASLLPVLSPALKDTLAVPGASSILKTVVDQIIARITAFSKA